MGVLVWRATVFASFGSFLGSYFTGASNIVEMQGFQKNFPNVFSMEESPDNLSMCSSGSEDSSRNLYTGLITAAGIFGGFIGTAVFGRFADRFSRTSAMIVCGVTSFVGSLIIALAFYNQMWMVILGRTIVGIGTGAVYVVIPIYVAEISPKEKRGALMSTLGFFYSFGLLLGLSVTAALSDYKEGWRLTNAILGFFSLVYAVGSALIPHSPWWLVSKNRDKEALHVLGSLHDHSKEEDFVNNYFVLEDLKEIRNTKQTGSLTQFFKWTYLIRFILVCGIFLITAQVGTLILFFPVTIFCIAGVNKPFLASVILGIFNVMATTISTLLVDRVGRKVLLAVPAAFSCLFSLVAGVLLHVKGTEEENTIIGYSVVALICLYSFSMFLGWMFVPWIIPAESFPHTVAGIAVSASNSLFWIFGTVVNFLTPVLVSPPFHIYGFLYLISATNLIGACFITLGIVETKGVSIEHIDELFTEPWIKRIGFRVPDRYRNETIN